MTPNPGPGAVLGAVRYFGVDTGRLGRPQAGGVKKLFGCLRLGGVGTEGLLSPVLTKMTCWSLSSSQENFWLSIILSWTLLLSKFGLDGWKELNRVLPSSRLNDSDIVANIFRFSIGISNNFYNKNFYLKLI